MPLLVSPSYFQARQLVDSLEDEALAPTLTRLILGPDLSALLLADPQPDAQSIADVLRRFKTSDKSLFPLARALASDFVNGPLAIVELAVDDLVLATQQETGPEALWEHPTQILDRPRPAFGPLLEACKSRLGQSDAADREVLERVMPRVERALRIEEVAASRRARRTPKRRPRRTQPSGS